MHSAKHANLIARVASFPGLPTVQFLITCSMQNRGGRSGLFYYVDDVSVYLGRQKGGGVTDRKYTFCTRVLHFELEAVHFSFHEHLKLQRLGQKLQEKASSFDGGILPPLST